MLWLTFRVRAATRPRCWYRLCRHRSRRNHLSIRRSKHARQARLQNHSAHLVSHRLFPKHHRSVLCQSTSSSRFCSHHKTSRQPAFPQKGSFLDPHSSSRHTGRLAIPGIYFSADICNKRRAQCITRNIVSLNDEWITHIRADPAWMERRSFRIRIHSHGIILTCCFICRITMELCR